MRLFMVGRAEGEAVTVGMPLLLPPSVLLYLRRLRGGARLPSEGGACKCSAWAGQVWFEYSSLRGYQVLHV